MSVDEKSSRERASVNRREVLGGIGALATGGSVGLDASPSGAARTIAAAGTSRPPARRLIRGGFLYAADSRNTVIPNSWVLIEGDTIGAIGVAGVDEPKSDVVLNAAGKMILPGFVNPHWHESFVEGPDAAKPDDSDLARTPFALGGDIEALGAYFGKIADVGEKLDPEEALSIARWSLWTQLRSGTTAIGDIGSLNSTDAMAQAALDLGMRIRVSRWGSDIMVPKGAKTFRRIADTDRQTADWEALLSKWNDHPSGLIGGMPTVLAAFGSSDEQLVGLREVAAKYRVPYAAHLAPLRNEAAALQAVFGRSSIGRFDELGLLTDRLLAVHTAHATEDEYRKMVGCGMKVCHSPANYGLLGEATVSQTKLIGRMLKDGVAVSCSTDGNVSYTGGMPEAMRATHLMHNEANGDNTFCPPTLVLATGTRHGALGLGWADRIGSVEAGKQADLVLIGIDDWRYRLISHPLSVFLIAGGSQDVDTVMVAGRILIESGRSATLDERDMFDAYAAAVRTAHRRIFG